MDKPWKERGKTDLRTTDECEALTKGILMGVMQGMWIIRPPHKEVPYGKLPFDCSYVYHTA